MSKKLVYFETLPEECSKCPLKDEYGDCKLLNKSACIEDCRRSDCPLGTISELYNEIK